MSVVRTFSAGITANDIIADAVTTNAIASKAVTQPKVDFSSADDTELTLETTGTDTDKPPSLKFDRSSETVADDMELAKVSINGKNDEGSSIEYAKIECIASDVSGDDEGAELKISIMAGGIAGTSTMTQAMRIGREDVAAGSGPYALMLNDNNADLNVKMKSVNNNNMFFLDAANDRIGLGKGAPTSSIHVRGSFCKEISNQTTGTLAITESHNVITCDTSGGNVTCNLPAISGLAGRIYTFIKTSASNSMIIDPNGTEKIYSVASPSGGASVTRNNNGSTFSVICTSAGWMVLSDVAPS